MRGGLAVGGLVGSGVDEDGDEGEQAVGQRVAEAHVVDEGVVVGRRLPDADAVLRVRRQRLLVRAVRRRGLRLQDQVLVEEQLPDVRWRPAVCHVRVVREQRRVCCRHQVDVWRAPRVVAREDGVELHHAVFVGLLDAAAVRRLETALARGGYAGVDAGGVAGPLVFVLVNIQVKSGKPCLGRNGV